MSSHPQLPSSAKLLGLVLKALRLRSAVEGLVSKRTLIRFFQEDTSIKPETRLEVVRAVVEAVFTEDLLDSWDVPNDQRKEFSEEMVGEFDLALVYWDQAAGTLQAHGSGVPGPVFAMLPWVRLFAIEGALRVSAYRTARAMGPISEAFANALIEGRAFDHLIQGYRSAAGGIPRDEIASGAGIYRSTVDEWLAGRSLPQSESILGLAALFTSRVQGLNEAETALNLRAAVAASEAVRWLWEVCPKQKMPAGFGPPRAAQFIIEFTTAERALRIMLEQLNDGSSAYSRLLWDLTLVGSSYPKSKSLVAVLLDWARDSYIRADVQGILTGEWVQRVMMLYRQLPDPKDRTREIELMKRRGFPAELVDAVMPMAEEMTAWGAVSPNPDGWNIERFPPPEPVGSDARVVVLHRDDLAHPDDQLSRQALDDQHLGGDRYAALAKHQELVRRSPEDAMYRYWLGCSLAAVGRVDEALIECRMACSIKPDWSLPAVEVAIILSNNRRMQEALDVIERTSRDYEVDAHMANVHGRILMSMGRFEDAPRLFREVLGQNRKHAGALVDLAHCLLMTGERKLGRKYAKRAFHAGNRTILDALKRGDYDR